MQKLNEELFIKILKEIENNNMVTEKMLANKYYYSERTIRRYIYILKNKGRIELVGYGKNRYWIIK